ncbi:MAG: acetoacetate decarboxylase family protein [Aggregatilineales bacterium]
MNELARPDASTTVVPPPWKLTGDGWVLFYRFDREFVRQPNAILPELRGTWRGGLGAIAWMNYLTSGVGPYGELLFIPGRFQAGKRRYHSISRIYVGTAASVVSGRANWGIPKELADFSIQTADDGLDHLSASASGTPIAHMVARPGRARLPVNTTLCPVTLMQHYMGMVFYTPLRIRAGVRWLEVLELESDPERFIDLGTAQPLGAVKLDGFRITFPVPCTLPAPESART